MDRLLLTKTRDRLRLVCLLRATTHESPNPIRSSSHPPLRNVRHSRIPAHEPDQGIPGGQAHCLQGPYRQVHGLSEASTEGGSDDIYV